MWVTGIIIKGDCDRFLEASIDYVSSVGMLTDVLTFKWCRTDWPNTIWTPCGIIRRTPCWRQLWKEDRDTCWFTLRCCSEVQMDLKKTMKMDAESSECGIYSFCTHFFHLVFWQSYNCCSAANVSCGCYWLNCAVLIYINKMNDNRFVKLI